MDTTYSPALNTMLLFVGAFLHAKSDLWVFCMFNPLYMSTVIAAGSINITWLHHTIAQNQMNLSQNHSS